MRDECEEVMMGEDGSEEDVDRVLDVLEVVFGIEVEAITLGTVMCHFSGAPCEDWMRHLDLVSTILGVPVKLDDRIWEVAGRLASTGMWVSPRFQVLHRGIVQCGSLEDFFDILGEYAVGKVALLLDERELITATGLGDEWVMEAILEGLGD